MHAVNTTTTTASPEAVWSRLVRADRWHEFYFNARRVRRVSGSWPELGPDTRFRWITFCTAVDTVVVECVAPGVAEPPWRLSWSGTGLGAVGHHAFVIEPTASGSRIHTEETQRGLGVRLLGPVLRPAMRLAHKRWIEQLARVAEEDQAR